MLYCKNMEHLYWSGWSGKIREWKITGFTLALLEGTGPVRYILSQMVLAALPFLGSSENPSMKAFAEMLENPAETRLFTSFLREEKS